MTMMSNEETVATEVEKPDGIQIMRYASVTDDLFAEHGVGINSVVLIAGDGMVQTDEDDPYVYRRLLIAVKVNEDGVADTSGGGFLIDGNRLSELNEDSQEFYTNLQEEAMQPTPDDTIN